jgi:hypothetical protein
MGFGATVAALQGCTTRQSIGPVSNMAERITILSETTADFSAVEAFYASVGYFQAIAADCVVISAKAEDKIVGAVRLSPESGVLVLRGMRIAQSHQRQGIGT